MEILKNFFTFIIQYIFKDSTEENITISEKKDVIKKDVETPKKHKTNIMKKELKDRIELVEFPKDQYFQEEYEKLQIVLHHTASGSTAKGDIAYWKSDASRIATPLIGDRNGKIYQLFSSKYYAYHLGIPGQRFRDFNLPYINLNKHTIGYELDSWGSLVEKGGKYYSWAGTEVSKENVIKYDKPHFVYANTPFFEKMGVVGEPCYIFEKYTDAQIESTRLLLEYWGEYYNIPLDYKGDDMWNVSKRALSGEKGVWTHVSYRKYGKNDLHPQPEIIEMLKSFTK